MSLIIETLICDKCGHSARIETDDPKILAEKKAEFSEIHKKCLVKVER
jgi:hypothetical protein